MTESAVPGDSTNALSEASTKRGRGDDDASNADAPDKAPPRKKYRYPEANGEDQQRLRDILDNLHHLHDWKTATMATHLPLMEEVASTLANVDAKLAEKVKFLNSDTKLLLGETQDAWLTSESPKGQKEGHINACI